MANKHSKTHKKSHIMTAEEYNRKNVSLPTNLGELLHEAKKKK